MSKRNPRTIARRARAPWIISAVAGVALVAVLATARSRPAHVHPEPRPDAAALAYGVMPPSFFARDARVYRVYQIAQEAATTLDGLYCYCYCAEQLGHRSLLQCFYSQHGAGCDVCLEEAILAYRMQNEGRTLSEIRAAADATFGRT